MVALMFLGWTGFATPSKTFISFYKESNFHHTTANRKMANGTHTEQLGTSIHNLLHPNQQRDGAQFGLDNTSQNVEIPQTIDFVKVKIDAKIIRQLHQLAKQGNAEAQSNLGVAYYNGEGVAQNYEKAIEWWQKAAQQKDILAQYCLGVAYMEGLGVATNNEKAREQFQQIINQLKEEFSYPKMFFDKDSDKIPNYPGDIRQWISLVARDKLSILHEREAKQDLKSFIAMMAHQFRSPLQSIEYNVEYKKNNQGILESVWTMSSLLEKMSLVSNKPEKLRKALLQDMHGECTLTSVLEKSLSLAFTQLLTINNRDKIIQHHLLYAKKTGQISKKTTRKQWRNNDANLVLWKQLQTEWETSFMQLPEPSLTNIVNWASVRLFPIEIIGFDNNPIQFQRYAITESVLMIVITEIILNAIKYYYSETNEPLKLRWQCQKDVCRFTCENPTSKNEPEMGKGNYQGHDFLKMLSKKLNGRFYVFIDENESIIHFDTPAQLLIPMEEI